MAFPRSSANLSSRRSARAARRLGCERLEDRRLLAVGNFVPDTVRPQIASIVSLGAPSTNATSIEWRVRFTERVVGVDASDFALRTDGTLTSSQPLVVTGSDQEYVVTARGLSGEGGARLDFFDTGSIFDLVGNPLATSRTPQFLAEQTVIGLGDIAANQFFQMSIAADVNRDGRMDLVVGVSSNSGADATRVAAVKILIGNGNGQFQPPLTFQAGFGRLYNLEVIDVTNDGFPDIIASWLGPSSSGVSFLKGNGNGTFEPRQAIPNAPVLGGMDVADFDADGKPDLVIADPSNGRVAILDGNGAGGFSAPRFLATQLAPYDVKTADFNGDGRPDIAVAHPRRDDQNPGSVGIFLNTGSGSFGPMQAFRTDSRAEIDSLVVGDFDGDGRPDFAQRFSNLSDSSNSFAAIGLNRFGGTQFRVQLSQIPGRLDAVADIDGDGWLDVVGADTDLWPGGLMFGRGTTAATFGTTREAVGGWTVADFNGDGRLDIATSSGVRLAVGFNSGSVRSSDPIFRSAVSNVPTGLTVVPRDSRAVLSWTPPQPVAGKTIVEYVITASRDDGIRWNSVSRAPGASTNAVVAGLANGTGYRFRVTAVFDDQTGAASAASPIVIPTVGRLPFVEALSRVGSSPTSGSQVRWTVRFSEPVTGVDAGDFVLASPGGAVSTAQPLQVTQTGDREYTVTASGLRGQGTVAVNLVDDGTIRDADGFRLTLPGSTDFGPRQAYEVGEFPSGVTVKDFDGDGSLDIALTSRLGTAIRYGRGDGTFPDFSVVSPSGGLLWSGDVNGDGRVDVALGDSDSLDTLTMAPDRSFQQAGSTPFSFPSSSVTADDGFGDFAQMFLMHNDSREAGTSSISWLLSSTAGFSPLGPAYVRGDMQFSNIVSADVNRDGTPDVIYLSSYGVGVMLGEVVRANTLGDGRLHPPQFYATATEFGYLAVADVNDDGFVDIVTTSRDSGSVLLGRADGSFAEPRVFLPGAGNRTPTVFDLDGDGKLDLLIPGVGGVKFLRGDGAGNFTLLRVINVGDGPNAEAMDVKVADVDRDGRMDLVAANFLTDAGRIATTISVLRGSTTGNFAGESFEIVAPVTPPGAPTSVSAIAGNAQASLTWTAPSSNGGASITEYVVQFSANSGSTWTTFNDGTSSSTSATVTGLTNGTAYVFRVAAVNSAGAGAFTTTSVAVTPVTGGVELGTTAAGYAIRTSGQIIPITFSGIRASASSPGGGWTAIAARAAGGGYELLWQHAGGSFVQWTLNSQGAQTANNGFLTPQQAAGWQTNGGNVFSVELGSTAAGYAIRNNGQLFQITYGGIQASASSPGGGWTAIAARAAGGGYELLWQHAGGSFVQWTLNSQGARTANNGFLAPQQAAGWQIGTADGAVELGNTAAGYDVRTNGQVIQITFNGSAASASNPGAGWTAIAARAAGSGYEVLWQHPGGTFAQWTLNGAGVRIANAALPGTTLATSWAGLGTNAQGHYVVRSSGQEIPVSFNGSPASANNPGVGWTAAAARVAGGGFQVLWRHTGGFFAQWTLDNSGVRTGNVALTSAQVQAGW